MEGINAIVAGELISLSEQELIDCDTSHNSGCKGGLMDPAFEWVINNSGIDSAADYPYTAHSQGHCNYSKACDDQFHIQVFYPVSKYFSLFQNLIILQIFSSIGEP